VVFGLFVDDLIFELCDILVMCFDIEVYVFLVVVVFGMGDIGGYFGY